MNIIKAIDTDFNDNELNKETTEFLLELVENLPVSIENYMIFAKNKEFFKDFYIFGGYLLRDTCITILVDRYGFNTNTAGALINKFIKIGLLGANEFGKYSIIYLKEKAFNCIYFHYKAKPYVVRTSRFGNIGLIKNTSLALFSLEMYMNYGLELDSSLMYKEYILLKFKTQDNKYIYKFVRLSSSKFLKYEIKISRNIIEAYRELTRFLDIRNERIDIVYINYCCCKNKKTIDEYRRAFPLKTEFFGYMDYFNKFYI